MLSEKKKILAVSSVLCLILIVTESANGYCCYGYLLTRPAILPPPRKTTHYFAVIENAVKSFLGDILD